MCETKVLQMCSFSIILTFNISIAILSFLPVYLSFHLNSSHSHADSPYLHSHLICRISTRILRIFPNSVP